MLKSLNNLGLSGLELLKNEIIHLNNMENFISDELLAKLKKQNPFLEWSHVNRKLKFSQEKSLIKYEKLYVPLQNMKYGDSIFIPMHKNFWRKFKNQFLNIPNTRVIYFMKDPKYNYGGIRVWNFNRVVPIRRPRMSFKII